MGGRKRERKAAEEDTSLAESDGPRRPDGDEEESTALSINEEMQRMLNQLREYDFEDDCDSLTWEETEETLLLWEDFSGYALAAAEAPGEVTNLPALGPGSSSPGARPIFPPAGPLQLCLPSVAAIRHLLPPRPQSLSPVLVLSLSSFL